MNRPRLTITGGIARKTAVCEDGANWIEFEVDFFADQSTGNCAVCDCETKEGWLCLDGGEEVCTDCVDIEAADSPTMSSQLSDIYSEAEALDLSRWEDEGGPAPREMES